MLPLSRVKSQKSLDFTIWSVVTLKSIVKWRISLNRVLRVHRDGKPKVGKMSLKGELSLFWKWLNRELTALAVGVCGKPDIIGNF